MFDRQQPLSWHTAISLHSYIVAYNKKRTVDKLLQWSVPIFMVSTREDLSFTQSKSHFIKSAEILAFCQTRSNTHYLPTNAKDNHNITSLFENILSEFAKSHKIKLLPSKHPKFNSLDSSYPIVSPSSSNEMEEKAMSPPLIHKTSAKPTAVSTKRKSVPSSLPTASRLFLKTGNRKVATRGKSQKVRQEEYEQLNKIYSTYEPDNIEVGEDSEDNLVVITTPAHNTSPQPPTTAVATSTNILSLSDIPSGRGRKRSSSAIISPRGRSNPPKPSPKDGKYTEPPSSPFRFDYKPTDRIFGGFLWKEGKIFKSWKLRYFILTGNLKLSYYTTSTLETNKGTAKITPANFISVNVPTSAPNQGEINPDGSIGYPLSIFCKDRTWKFKARSISERNAWIDCIQTVVSYAKERKANPKKVGSSGPPKKPPKPKTKSQPQSETDNSFFAMPENYLYILEIYRAKNLPRMGNDFVLPNAYIRVEFITCKSGNEYQSDIVHADCAPVFHSKFFEMGEKSDIEQILLTVYHSPTPSTAAAPSTPVSTTLTSAVSGSSMVAIKDAVIGSVPINVQKYDKYGDFVWLPILSKPENALFHDDQTSTHAGLIELRLRMVSLDEAIMAHEYRKTHPTSHIIAVHLDKFVTRDSYNDLNFDSSDEKSEQISTRKPTLTSMHKFQNAVAQIEWGSDEMFESSYRTAKQTNPKQKLSDCAGDTTSNELTFEWNEHHFIFSEWGDEAPRSDLVLHILDEDIESEEDIKGMGTVSWDQLVSMADKQACSLKLPILSTPIVAPDATSLLITQPIVAAHNPAGGVSALMKLMNPNHTYYTPNGPNPTYASAPPLLAQHMATVSEPETPDLTAMKETESDNPPPTDLHLSQQRPCIGVLHITLQILNRNEVEKDFLRRFLSLHSSQKTLTADDIYGILLTLGMHPSDEEFDTYLKKQSNPASIPVTNVFQLLSSNRFETSISILHFLYAYLQFKFTKPRLKKQESKLVDIGWWSGFDRPPLYSNDKDDFFVVDRHTGLRIREHIPGYLKIALKAMYDTWLARVNKARTLQQLNRFSESHCKQFDEESSAALIEPFVKLHNVNMTDFEPTDPSQYKTFNEFFARPLRSDNNVRPLDEANNEFIIVSPVDGRIVTYEYIIDCTDLWVKGSKFGVTRLISEELYTNYIADVSKNGISIAVARLAPSDYHRFHYPISGKIIAQKSIDGALYCVSPIVVTRGVNVLSENRRYITVMDTCVGTVVIVCVASFMEGSCELLCKVGDEVSRGDEMGLFKYGGSCVIVLFEREMVVFDDDLVNRSVSRHRIETLVKCRSRIGNRRVQTVF